MLTNYKQRFLNVRDHQNPLEGFSAYRCPSLSLGVSDIVGRPEHKICISNQFAGRAGTAGSHCENLCSLS